jgi:hypothetical protein
MMKTRTMISLVAATSLALAACGDDDDGTASDATEAPPTTPATATTEAAPTTAAAPPTTAAPATTAEPDTTASTEASGTAEAAGSHTAGSDDPYCALVVEMFGQESTPTAEQLTRYQELAPAEIADAVAAAAPPLAEAGDDMVAFFSTYAVDDVETAVAQIDAFENEACGVEHEDPSPPPGSTREIEDGAARVDVVASDYAFQVPTVEAGRTSFVLTNQGHEAHFLLVVKLAEGVTLEQAMASNDDSMIEGAWETGLAAPDGTDEEAITFDVEPGTYGALCFIPAPDGTPHAFMGMQTEFTVT